MWIAGATTAGASHHALAEGVARAGFLVSAFAAERIQSYGADVLLVAHVVKSPLMGHIFDERLARVASATTGGASVSTLRECKPGGRNHLLAISTDCEKFYSPALGMITRHRLLLY